MQSAATQGKAGQIDGGGSASGKVHQENGSGDVAEHDDEETESDGTMLDEVSLSTGRCRVKPY